MYTRRLGLLTVSLALACAPAQAAPRAAPAPPPWLPRYDLDVRLDVAGHKAHVVQTVTWTNRHARPACEVVFNAHARYLTPAEDVGLLAKTLEILRMNADEGIYTGRRPLDLRGVRLGDQDLSFSFQGDTATDLVVLLPAPVNQGESITLRLDFTLYLPQKQGRWGQWEGVTQLSNWVPMVAVHDEAGWHPTPFIPWHQPFYNESGHFRARVVLPADQKVACSGQVESDRPLGGGTREVVITAAAVRDFALLCSARYVEYAAEAQTLPGLPPVRVRCLAFPEHEHYARTILKIACAAFPLYSQWMGPYPWPEFTFAESYFGWNGNECATLVMIDERVFGMPHIGVGYVEYLIAHETCHQWWYNLIGTDGYRETWQDEAMATFFAHKFLDRTRGPNNRMIDYPRGLSWLPNIARDSYRSTGVYGVMGRGELGPTVQEMTKFGHIANLFGVCYDKGWKVVALIEDRLGEDAFLDFMRRLYDRYAYRVLRVCDFRQELEEFTGQSWEDFFRRWLYGAGLPDWCVEEVRVERHGAGRARRWAPDFPSALRGRSACPCKVTVLLRQKGDNDEATVLGFCLYEGKTDDGRPAYQVRLPVVPGGGVVQLDSPPGRVETLPDGRVRAEVELPCEPAQISVDPDNLLLDREPSNNHWKKQVRWRLTPLYTMLDETDLTTAYDRWNVTAGPWLYGPAYADPWYQRATVVGARAGLYRTQQFAGGAYLGYRTGFRDVVAGVDGVWDHWPWPRTQVGFSAEHRLATILDGDAQPNRAAVYGRYVFQYNSSLYLPPIHFLEAFATAQENFLPYVRHPAPGSLRYEGLGLAGLHYRLNYLTPYWDPRGGLALDVTYAGGFVDIDKRMAAHQVYGQFSTVKGLPDLSESVEGTAAERVAGPVLRYLGETRVAVRLAGAAGLPDRAQYFPLGGDTMLRGFTMAERQGSVLWLASAEWRFPLWKRLRWDVCDHIAAGRALYGALFYDVGDVFTRGHTFGPVPHSLGGGLRLDVTWFGFVERATLRLDVAKAVNVDTPVQFLFGVNMPF